MLSYLLPEIKNLNIDINKMQEDIKSDQTQGKGKIKRQLSHTCFESIKCP